jgi:hypothetical protein
VFALAEATGDPEPREHPRWPWVVPIEALLVIPSLDAAPPVEAIGVAAHYALAVEALASVAAG